MRKIYAFVFVGLLCSSILSSCQETKQTNSTAAPLTINADGSINPPSNGDRFLPLAGDIIRCDDGTNYRISDVSQYERSLSDLKLSLNCSERWEGEMLNAEAIHYSDGSGDYLFIKNGYETLRMLYCLRDLAGKDAELTVRLSIPEEVSSNAFWPWDPKQMEALYMTTPGREYCVEAWDMFKDGKFYRTSYQFAAIQKDIS